MCVVIPQTRAISVLSVNLRVNACVYLSVERVCVCVCVCVCLCMCVGKREGTHAEIGGNKRGRKDGRSRDGPDLWSTISVFKSLPTLH